MTSVKVSESDTRPFTAPNVNETSSGFTISAINWLTCSALPSSMTAAGLLNGSVIVTLVIVVKVFALDVAVIWAALIPLRSSLLNWTESVLKPLALVAVVFLPASVYWNVAVMAFWMVIPLGSKVSLRMASEKVRLRVPWSISRSKPTSLGGVASGINSSATMASARVIAAIGFPKISDTKDGV